MRLRSCVLAILPATLLATAALSLPAQTFKPAQFVFTGAPDYPTADLIAATGLRPGQPLTPPEIDQGAQRLIDTGLFADLHFNVNNTALTFTLVPQPASLTLPALFDNFVLFDSKQLAAQVHARVPLFFGSIPNHGNLNQSVQDALTAILLEKGITATVDSVSASDTVGGPVNAMLFSIADPPVHIRALQVTGVSPAAQQKIDSVSHTYVASDFSHLSEIAIRRRLEDAYRDLGFLDVTIDPATHGSPVIEPKQILIDLSTTVHEGSPYHIAQIVYPTAEVVPSISFEKGAALKPGDAAAQNLLAQTTLRINHEFRRRGYLQERTSLTESKDPATHTVAYTYTTQPGDLYHFKAIALPGISESQQKQFDKTWTLKPGAPFDVEEALEILHKLASASDFRGYTITPAIVPNRTDHTVQINATIAKSETPGS